MGKIVAVVCEVESVESGENCIECGQELEENDTYFVLVHKGSNLNPALACSACAKEFQDSF